MDRARSHRVGTNLHRAPAHRSTRQTSSRRARMNSLGCRTTSHRAWTSRLPWRTRVCRARMSRLPEPTSLRRARTNPFRRRTSSQRVTKSRRFAPFSSRSIRSACARRSTSSSARLYRRRDRTESGCRSRCSWPRSSILVHGGRSARPISRNSPPPLQPGRAVNAIDRARQWSPPRRIRARRIAPPRAGRPTRISRALARVKRSTRRARSFSKTPRDSTPRARSEARTSGIRSRESVSAASRRTRDTRAASAAAASLGSADSAALSES